MAETTALEAKGPSELVSLVREALEKGQVDLVPYPAVVLRLQAVLAQPNFRIEDVTKLVSADPVITAAVFAASAAAANVARLGQTNVASAVMRLGARNVSRIALAASLGKAMLVPGPLRELKFLFWRRAVSGALLAQALAGGRGLDPEAAFVVALLDGFAKTVALSAVERMAANGQRLAAGTVAEWQHLAETSHESSAQIVAKRWRLPSLVAAVVGDGQHPDADAHQSLLGFVRQAIGVMEGTAPDFAPYARDSAEVARARALIPDLPNAIFDMVDRTDARAEPSDLVLRSASLPPGTRPVAWQARDLSAKHPSEYRVSHVSPTACVLLGEHPLQEHWLGHFEVRGPAPPFAFWAVVEKCSEDVDGFQIVTHPFALGRDAGARWNELAQAA